MKFVKTLFICAVCLITTSLSAQKIESGTMTMELTEVTSDDEQQAAGLEMMRGMVTEYSFTPEKSLSTMNMICLLYTSPSPRDRQKSRMPSSA